MAGDREFNYVLAYATVLIFLHLLDIRPTEFEQFSVRVKIPDVSIVYGGISLLLWNSIYRAYGYMSAGVDIFPYYSSSTGMRSKIRSAQRELRKKRATPLQIKKAAKSSIALNIIFTLPFVMVIIVICIVATVISIFDLFSLAKFIWDHVNLDRRLTEMGL